MMSEEEEVSYRQSPWKTGLQKKKKKLARSHRKVPMGQCVSSVAQKVYNEPVAHQNKACTIVEESHKFSN